MLEEIPQYFDPLSIEREISVYWKENDIMQKSFERNRGKERFSFLEGPPTANGPPHVGHAETRAMKDLFLRYKTMKGFYINPRIAGWDCHGLPVEIEVEKSLGIKNKSEIEKMGIAKFNKLCKESVFKYVKQWEEVSNRLGYWVDYRNAYITMDDKYIESEWWALKELYNRGLLFKDFRISPYCPRCGTTLSTHEVAQGYREIEDYSIYVKFHVEGRDEYFVAWTTTPWTLPANEYLVVNPDLSYILVEHKGLKLWMAEERAPSIIKDYLVLERRSGKELIGTKYEQLIPFLKLKTGLYVVGGDFVTKDDGSGIVHAAPAFGADDYSVMKRENGELYITVNESGKISLESPWEGMDVQSASDEIIKYLKTSGKLLKTEKATHSYPFCWRCGTRLIYYPVESWFIGVSRARDKIVQLNKTINWKPDYIRDGRFGNFLEEGKDWALSRNRFWGTPLPVWTCKNGHIFVPGSKKELLDRSSSIPDDFDLHRPKVDEIQIRCKDCGEMMKREPYPIDTWFDSGSAFFAQFHYPFENQQAFFENHPVDFISEAIDQTRGWFYSLHVISSLVFGKPAFRNVVVMEFVLNSQGEKMSKSRGDKVNPIELIDKMGTDALRLFFFEGPPWKPKRFSEDAAVDFSRKLLGTIYNSYFLFSTNARLDGWTPGKEKITNSLDRWMLESTNRCISLVTEHLDNYEPHLALDQIMELSMELSQWYLRLSRDRFWSNTINEDKRSSYYVTYYSLLSIVKMLAPFAPYFSDYIFSKMTGEESVHLSDFPEATGYDETLLDEMHIVKGIVETGRRIRQKNGLILRRPVREIVITSGKYEEIVKKYGELIAKELNAKIIRIDSIDKYLTRKFELNKKVAGKKFGKDLEAAEIEFEREDRQAEFQVSGEVQILGNTIRKEDVLVEERLVGNYVSDPESGNEVLVSTDIDRELYLEGMAREIVRRIQSMRKDADLKYTDRIYVSVKGDNEIEETMRSYQKYILESTQAAIKNDIKGMSKTWNVSDHTIIIELEKA